MKAGAHRSCSFYSIPGNYVNHANVHLVTNRMLGCVCGLPFAGGRTPDWFHEHRCLPSDTHVQVPPFAGVIYFTLTFLQAAGSTLRRGRCSHWFYVILLALSPYVVLLLCWSGAAHTLSVLNASASVDVRPPVCFCHRFHSKSWGFFCIEISASRHTLIRIWIWKNTP